MRWYKNEPPLISSRNADLNTSGFGFPSEGRRLQCVMKIRRALLAARETVRYVARNFCENTSLHGLRYVYGGERTEHPNGRMLRTMWLMVCLVSIGFTMVMGAIAWTRFRTTPTITTIETMTYPIWNIHFPGVTVCNINKVDKRKAKVIVDRLVREFGLSEVNATGLLVAQASLINFEQTNLSFIELEAVLGQMGWNPNRLLLELSQPCSELIKVCYWLGSEVPCAQVIHRTKTDNGFCCSYNVDQAMQPLVARRNGDSTDQGAHHGPYRPQRLSGAGRHVGLSLLIDIEPDTYMAPTKSFYGAEIYVHDSMDFPSDADFEHVAQPGWDVVMSVIPLPIESSSTMRQVPEEMRKCFLPEESSEKQHAEMNLNVCLAQCRLRTILKLCNCVPFYYADLRYFYSLRPDSQSEADLTDVEFGMDCDCMPPCSVLNYNVETITSQRLSKEFVSSQFGGRNVSQYATLNVHFKDIYCVKYKRDAYMTWDSLVATFGGIFGLCMGGSVLSLVEMLYYFTVKPFTAYRRAHRGKRSGNRTKTSSRRHPPIAVRPYDGQRFPVGYFLRRNVLARSKDVMQQRTNRGQFSWSVEKPPKQMPEISDGLSFIY
ncbi:AGAP006704-PA-like protein [Anopheles sinensis]|uniref:AGAP006704-PA-like protein n=1 Tax=Anopheles sinensis TaxID=74873 RepID=A0A084WLM2_ANOSI|nr:AGAP006704-PA-like protein [Anopheles sinensis]